MKKIYYKVPNPGDILFNTPSFFDTKENAIKEARHREKYTYRQDFFKYDYTPVKIIEEKIDFIPNFYKKKQEKGE